MKVLLLSDINSPHTEKWAIKLSQRGLEIGIFSLSNDITGKFDKIPNIHVFTPLKFEKSIFNSNIIYKSRYIKALPYLKKTIKQFNPHILHAHYATSYGLLGALIKFHPYIISVWG